MPVSKEEADYFNKQAINKITDYIKFHPEHEHSYIGLIHEADDDYIWFCGWTLKPIMRPRCKTCGNEMSEGTLFNPDGLIGYPYWFCNNDFCDGFKQRLEKNKKDIYKYRNNEGEQSFINDYLLKMNIPKSYHRKTLENFKKSKNFKDNIKNEMENKSNLFIYGTTGTGKTHLAVALLNKYGNYNPSQYRFENIPNLLNQLQNLVNEDENYITLLNNTQRYKTLILDDLGAGKISDFRKEIIYNIISGRIFEENQTIITTNMNLEQIKNVYDERLSSRLSGYVEIKMSGSDYRRKDKNKNGLHTQTTAQPSVL